MKKHVKFGFIFFVFAVIASFSACPGKNPAIFNEMRFGFTTEPASLDPLNPGNTADGRSILFNVFEGLVKPDSNGILQPCLADSWTIEQDSTVYIFKIRDDVRFHDGSLLNVLDVKFTLETAISTGFSGMENIDMVLTEGRNQIKVILKTPDPEFLPYLTVGIVKAGKTDRAKDVVGTGPFFIESYSTQRVLVLKKFENYWDVKKANLDRVIIVFFENFDALMTALRGGGIDGARLTGSMTSQLDHRFFDFFDSYSAAVQLLALNNDSPPLDDKRVREALNYGIDIKNIIDTAFFGMGVSSGSPVIPGLTRYYENNLDYPYDPAKALSLLSQAGYDEQNKKLSLEITVPSNFNMHVDTAQVIADQLGKIGVTVNIRLVDWDTWLSDVYFGRQYQATIISLDSQTVSPKGFLSRYKSDAGDNFINFKNDEFDGIFNSILSEPDEASRVESYKKAQRVIVENAASVYIQDIFYSKVFFGGLFSGDLNYPLYVIDFASFYRIKTD
jgi:peptide/nickel transport system substrate-binding protein